MQNYLWMTRSYHDIKITSDITFGGFDDKQRYYIHKYTIDIENNSDISFQLLSRVWHISDGLSWNKKVEGDGVIGQQPIIHPGQSYSYESWCPIPSTIGYMKGEYICKDLTNEAEFRIEVPIMTFIAQELFN